MTRRCSHCSHNGHNSRTCPNRGVKLFGVHLTDGSIRKSASMGNLSLFAGSAGSLSPGYGLEGCGASVDGYASEELVRGSSSRERKRGVPWTEEEHRMFLLGLQKLGKGDWRGISRKYVVSKTPTQVASHAQKYFIRQSNAAGKRRRRTSLFDMVPIVSAESVFFPISHHQEPKTQAYTSRHDDDNDEEEELESMDSNNSNNDEIDAKQHGISAPRCAYEANYAPCPAPFAPHPWPDCAAQMAEDRFHEIVRPTPMHTKSPINVDQLLGMSRLSIGESGAAELNLLVANRHSAFRPNFSARSSVSFILS